MPNRSITPGRKFSTTTSASFTIFRKIALPSALFVFSVIDFLLQFCARKLVPIRRLFSAGRMPSLRARSPSLGFSTLITSAPSSARCRVVNGPERTFVRSRTLMPARMRGVMTDQRDNRETTERQQRDNRGSASLVAADHGPGGDGADLVDAAGAVAAE